MSRMYLLRSAMFAVLVMSLSLLISPAAAQDATATYKAKCAMCHGADGKGATPAGKSMGAHDFSSPDVQKQSDVDLEQIIAKGKNKMPSYANKLKPAEIKDLVAYVRKLGKG
ncbi:MAG TPA: cytochrome c [Terriglobales bacterium]|jgi:cytochrome c6|nr:cytochrome c [Terriglobales bacterium]